MKYKILKQDLNDNRVFELQDTYGNKFMVDIYTAGAFVPPTGVDDTDESWNQWLGSFVGKTIFIRYITPYRYFSGGDTYIVDNN